jgi:hypothetical protein
VRFMLHKHGNELITTDSNWANMFYTWPEPSIESEEWRYKTIVSCKDAIEKKTSQLDTRAVVKREFRMSVLEVQEELFEVLGGFGKLDKDTNDFIHDIPLTAARLWLNMCTQHSRLFLVMLGSEVQSASDLVSLVHKDKLCLNLQPELRKYGGTNGQQLESEAVLVPGSIETLSVQT